MLPGNEEERRYLTFFRYKSAPGFAGYYDNCFWNDQVLQIVCAEPSVFHAVIALAALHKSFEDGIEHGPDNEHYSTQQYTNAIAGLNSYRCTNGSIDIVLICCILFISFDSIRGDFLTAAQHLYCGFRILSHWRENQGCSKIIQDELVPIFVRLSVQVKSLTESKIALTIPSANSTLLPKKLSNLNDARNTLFNIMEQILDFDSYLENSLDLENHIS